ncbi:SAM-dependent methyltransferase [candidate division LCP-89 bacterium B3_LCP]|uniref:SAM-dependent methyltransferase n=1 Tax=candidate division LCP-89 bacterium B3_LCP TaxID=2012998 RepID=A0A532USX4_UNCL8|nr:MAG: SAM-dependent methyltransferase [candidate division LCP-89 bacterium B3_LCP]
MFNELEKINSRPLPFQFYFADRLWTDEYISERMLECHLNESIDVASRRIDFIDKSVEWIVSHFSAKGDTHIADFGCGPGLYTTRLAQRGAIVTGIDFSKRSIQYAETVAAQKRLNISYHPQNYLEFESSKRFDLIIMIMCDFCVLSPEQRKLMLRKFNSLLKPGGSILLDVYSLNGYNQREEAAKYEYDLLGGFWSREKYYGFLNTFKYEDEKVILDKYTIVEEEQTRTVCNWLQYFTRESLTTEVEAAGLMVSEIYGDVAGNPLNPDSSEFAVVISNQ